MFDLEDLKLIEDSLNMREQALATAKRCTDRAFDAYGKSRELLDASYDLLEKQGVR
ncbi:MAG: hypothetical protein OXC60_16020 [Litoreibacter sp.]|nr:hypothetical protein [Litoreibacter sp.]MCY4336166.1 hypothetical protein [Litoreibacter sp.]